MPTTTGVATVEDAAAVAVTPARSALPWSARLAAGKAGLGASERDIPWWQQHALSC
jgi:hypothetical protein